MLKTTKTTTINGTSLLETGEVVATMHCSIAENGNISTSTNIVNNDLYEKNKTAVRKDIDDFMATCRAKEDEEVTA